MKEARRKKILEKLNQYHENLNELIENPFIGKIYFSSFYELEIGDVLVIPLNDGLVSTNVVIDKKDYEYYVFDGVIPPKGVFPKHKHNNYEKCSVVYGSMVDLCDGDDFIVTQKGETRIYKPGVEHTSANPSDTQNLRIIVTHAKTKDHVQ